MSTQSPGEVTQLLLKWSGGDEQALDRLFQMVYAELQQLARQCLRRERDGHAVQTGTLVHEACLRLIGDDRPANIEWSDRKHFFGIAARLMRRVLVEEARRRGYGKRGADFTRVSFDEALLVSEQRDVELIALDEALERLEEFAPRKCRVVELRYFGGLTIEETAEAMGVTEDMVKRDWRTAKLWLLSELNGAGKSDDGQRTQETD
ncbi:MAG: sigma-70 family RNA polymerase sigma factor [Blastocatellales bacterium]